MVCPACGTQVEDGSRFCDNCGRPLTASAPQPATPATAVAAPPAAAAPVPPPLPQPSPAYSTAAPQGPGAAAFGAQGYSIQDIAVAVSFLVALLATLLPWESVRGFGRSGWDTHLSQPQILQWTGIEDALIVAAAAVLGIAATLAGRRSPFPAAAPAVCGTLILAVAVIDLRFYSVDSDDATSGIGLYLTALAGLCAAAFAFWRLRAASRPAPG